MMTPEADIENILFGPAVDKKVLKELGYDVGIDDVGEFAEINWLNTPGPIYTTFTDNCGNWTN
jgi:hypothetical protein